MQWHPTILSKLAIVPQRFINAYSRDKHGAEYQDGDIVVRFPGCTSGAATPASGEVKCDEEARRFLPKLKQAFDRA